jgi:hypothetical protein
MQANLFGRILTIANNAGITRCCNPDDLATQEFYKFLDALIGTK